MEFKLIIHCPLKAYMREFPSPLPISQHLRLTRFSGTATWAAAKAGPTESRMI